MSFIPFFYIDPSTGKPANPLTGQPVTPQSPTGLENFTPSIPPPPYLRQAIEAEAAAKIDQAELARKQREAYEASKSSPEFIAKSALIKKAMEEGRKAEASKKEEAKPSMPAVPSAEDFLHNQVIIAANANKSPGYQAFIRNGRVIFTNRPEGPVEDNVAGGAKLSNKSAISYIRGLGEGGGGTFYNNIGGMETPQFVPTPSPAAPGGGLGYFAPGPGMDVTNEVQARLAADQELRTRALEAQQKAQDILNPQAAIQRAAQGQEAMATAKEMGGYNAIQRAMSLEMMQKDPTWKSNEDALTARHQSIIMKASQLPPGPERDKAIQQADADYIAGRAANVESYQKRMLQGGTGRLLQERGY